MDEIHLAFIKASLFKNAKLIIDKAYRIRAKIEVLKD